MSAMSLLTPRSSLYDPDLDANNCLPDRKRRRTVEVDVQTGQLPRMQRVEVVDEEEYNLIKSCSSYQEYQLKKMRPSTPAKGLQPTPPQSPDIIEIALPQSSLRERAPEVLPRSASLRSSRAESQVVPTVDSRVREEPRAPPPSPSNTYLRELAAQPLQPNSLLPQNICNITAAGYNNAYQQHLRGLTPAAPIPRPLQMPPPVVPTSPLVRHEGATENKKTDDSIVFEVVTSQLLLTGKRNVPVTVGEIRRRMGAPENQDWQMIARLTKRAGNPTALAQFRRKLCIAGIGFDERIPIGASQSTIEMLLEADAVVLAKDFTKILSAEMSKRTLAAIAAPGASKFDEIHAEPIQQLLSLAKAHVFRAGRTPGTIAIREDSVTRAVNDFARQTHGFGPLAVAAVIDQLLIAVSVIPDAKSYLEEATAPVIIESSDDVIIDPALIAIHSNDEAVFDHNVQPRIGYKAEPEVVTVGELRRRVLGPESMNSSAIIQFLRKTKMKDSNAKFREQTEMFGLTVADGQKKMAPSAWMALTEREAMALAHETGSFLELVPASAEMRQWSYENTEAAQSLRAIASAVQCAMLAVGVKPADRKVQTSTDLRILRFAMITHHFGHSFFAFVMQWLEKALC